MLHQAVGTHARAAAEQLRGGLCHRHITAFLFITQKKTGQVGSFLQAFWILIMINWNKINVLGSLSVVGWML